MKGFRILLLCGAAALPQLAAAENSPQALGIVNAILTYCAEVDPRNAQSFQAEWKSLGSGTTLGHPAGGDSQKAFNQITAELRLVPKLTVAQNCSVGAVQWNGKPAVKDRDGDGDKDDPKVRDRDRDRDDSKDRDRDNSKDKDAGSAKDGKDSSHDRDGKDSDKR